MLLLQANIYKLEKKSRKKKNKILNPNGNNTVAEHAGCDFRQM